MTSDLDTINEVNERARAIFNAKLAPGEQPLPAIVHHDMSRVGAIRRAWEAARDAYKEETGIDVTDAIRRHEAWLRSPENAPQLYIEKR
jgi:hypothetical protein